MTLTATANPVNYSVTYTDITGTGGTVSPDVVNLPDPTNNSTSATEITLSTVTPSKTGFKFNGWCDSVPTVAADKTATCTGSTYAAGTSYPINQTTSNVITLYATWTIPTYDITIKPTTGIKNITMVNSTGTVETCTSATASTTGCTIFGLTYGKSYDIAATTEDGYTFSAWSPEGAGSIANITDSSTNFTVGDGTTTITAVAAGAAAKSVKVNFSYAGGGTAGVSSVSFKETNTGTTAGTVTSSGGSVILTPGINYTVTTTSATDYGIKSYALNNTSYGTLATTTDNLTYFLPNTSSDSAEITVNTCLKNIGGDTINMQDFNNNIDYMCDDATGTLRDARDGQIYTIAKIMGNGTGGISGGRLWMTRNLAIGCNGSGDVYGNTAVSKSLNDSDSNLRVGYTWSTSTAPLSTATSYTDSYMTCSDEYGAWYNFAAASAGTVTGSSTDAGAGSSVCPFGWRLPNHNEASAIPGEDVAFNPVKGGVYDDATLIVPGRGSWWLSGGGVGPGVGWFLNVVASAISTAYASRDHGFYIRCVRN